MTRAAHRTIARPVCLIPTPGPTTESVAEPVPALAATFAVGRAALERTLGCSVSGSGPSVPVVFRLDPSAGRLRVLAEPAGTEPIELAVRSDLRVRALPDGWHAECPGALTALFTREGRTRYANPVLFVSLGLPGGRYELSSA